MKLRLSVVWLNKSQLLKLFETCKYLLQQNQIKKGKKKKKKMKPSDDKTSVGYSELCQTSRMKSFGKIGNYF